LGRPSRQRAFTFTDLLTLLAVISILALVVLPALARTKPSVQRLQCLNNLSELMRDVLMYTHDFHDFFPPNPDDGNALYNPAANWVAGDVATGAGQEFCPDVLIDPLTSAIASETAKSVNLFHCPSDQRTGLYQSNPNGPSLFPNLIGKTIPAARSYSMNSAVGTVDANFYATGNSHGGPMIYPVNGPWLTGSHDGNRHNSPWRTYGKTTDMVAPTPANIFALADESPLSINDGCLGTSVSVPLWVDWPATYHNLGCVFAFGDGHTELHHWTGTTLPATTEHVTSIPATDPDWLWMNTHTTALAK